jgi:transcription-repair coupling factor (superfamily II helicase)
MRERDLEQLMLDFYHRRFNVLVCTTIIESGIDVPTANTIVIDRADRFGLAQIHQLRGRVGRSHHRAYAYLITPPRKVMTADAIKRLEALESLEELGAGFTLATHDLEIRGAGELLGMNKADKSKRSGTTCTWNSWSAPLRR